MTFLWLCWKKPWNIILIKTCDARRIQMDISKLLLKNTIISTLYSSSKRERLGFDFTKSRKSKISRKCEFQSIKSLEITLTITLTINLRLMTFCEIDPWCLTSLNNSSDISWWSVSLVEETGVPGENHRSFRKSLWHFITQCCIEYTSPDRDSN